MAIIRMLRRVSRTSEKSFWSFRETFRAPQGTVPGISLKRSENFRKEFCDLPGNSPGTSEKFQEVWKKFF